MSLILILFVNLICARTFVNKYFFAMDPDRKFETFFVNRTRGTGSFHVLAEGSNINMTLQCTRDLAQTRICEFFIQHSRARAACMEFFSKIR